jgi:hypothetical protein
VNGGSLSDFFARDDGLAEHSETERIFAEEPVSLDEFVTNKHFLGNPKLSPVQYEAVRHIERVYMPEVYPLMAEEFGGYWADPVRMTNLITLQWGKGSGKDHVCRVASLRVSYLLLCLRSPQEFYGMPDQDSIHLLNIANNAPQANRAFFQPMTQAVKRGWFSGKAHPTRDTIQYEKGIEAVSGHSDAEGQEGLNLMLGVADEIDAFKARDEMVGNGSKMREASTSADSILDMLKTSASTRFPDSYKRVAISYPRYLGSTIQRLTAAARKDIEEVGQARSRQFVSGPLATWEVNPRVTGKDKFADDYRVDPDAAAAKYECKPKRAINRYFRSQEIFKQAVVAPEQQPIEVSYQLATIRSKKTGSLNQVWEPVFTFDPKFKPIQGARYALHGDLARVGDRAGIAMSHIQSYDERTETYVDEDGVTTASSTLEPIIRNDFVFGFESDIAATPAREIQIRWARVLCFELIKRGFNVVRFTFDQFQSTDTMQILEQIHGIESKRVSADINDDVWRNLRDVASDGRLRMPFNQLLFDELESLSKVGNKVDHPPNGSKDLADAFACSIVGAIAAGGVEDVDGSIVESGGSLISSGEFLAPLAGQGEFGSLMGGSIDLPLGMKGMSLG